MEKLYGFQGTHVVNPSVLGRSSGTHSYSKWKVLCVNMQLSQPQYYNPQSSQCTAASLNLGAAWPWVQIPVMAPELCASGQMTSSLSLLHCPALQGWMFKSHISTLENQEDTK